MAEPDKKDDKKDEKKPDRKESKISPWSLVFVIALGAILIGMALPFLGEGIGGFFSNLGTGLEAFSRKIANAKQGLFVIAIFIAAVGGSIALVKYWMSKK